MLLLDTEQIERERSTSLLLLVGGEKTMDARHGNNTKKRTPKTADAPWEQSGA